jgi:hypothetical protein
MALGVARQSTALTQPDGQAMIRGGRIKRSTAHSWHRFGPPNRPPMVGLQRLPVSRTVVNVAHRKKLVDAEVCWPSDPGLSVITEDEVLKIFPRASQFLEQSRTGSVSSSVPSEAWENICRYYGCLFLGKFHDNAPVAFGLSGGSNSRGSFCNIQMAFPELARRILAVEMPSRNFSATKDAYLPRIDFGDGEMIESKCEKDVTASFLAMKELYVRIYTAPYPYIQKGQSIADDMISISDDIERYRKAGIPFSRHINGPALPAVYCDIPILAERIEWRGTKFLHRQLPDGCPQLAQERGAIKFFRHAPGDFRDEPLKIPYRDQFRDILQSTQDAVRLAVVDAVRYLW